MRYRRLGKTDLQVSELGFGAWAIGGDKHGHSYGPTDQGESLRAIRRAFELGCTFFDTADIYGHGLSEKLLHQGPWDRTGKTASSPPRRATIFTTGHFAKILIRTIFALPWKKACSACRPIISISTNYTIRPL